MFEALFEAAPDAIVLVDRDGRIVRVNQQVETIFGYNREELLGKPVEILLPTRFRGRHVGHRSLYYAKSRMRPMGAGLELYGRRRDGSEFPIDVMLSPLETDHGFVTIAAVRDITQQVQTEESLRQSEARFRTIFEKGAMGISLLDLEGRVVTSNPALQEMLGYSEEELRGMVFTEFTHPADIGMDMNLFQELAAGKRNQYRLEKRYLRKDGWMVWGHLTVSLVRDADGNPQFAINMVKDITERKQMEAELAEVRHRLMESKEAERLRLAQELHDGPLQDLYGMSYRLIELGEVLPDEGSLRQMVATQATLQQVIERLRALSIELRPPALAPFGLERAIHSHAEDFQTAHPELKIQLDVMSDGQMLPERVRLALFRVYQQAMNNVIRHAQASLVSIHFALDAEQIVLEIQDDGCGFPVPRHWIELARQGHLGLVGAAERAEALGGRLEIESTPGEGTSIRVVVPYSIEQGRAHSVEPPTA
jgi:PAS domain S-box-containing protein